MYIQNMVKVLVLTLMSLASVASINAQSPAATPISATQGIIELNPDKVIIPSTGEYLYLAKVGGDYAIFVSKNADLYERFRKKGNDSLIKLEGAVFKPLQHYSKKQWKKLSKQIKISFPFISQKELENMNLYLLFNWAVEKKNQPQSKPVPVVVNPNPTTNGGNDGP